MKSPALFLAVQKECRFCQWQKRRLCSRSGCWDAWGRRKRLLRVWGVLSDLGFLYASATHAGGPAHWRLGCQGKPWTLSNLRLLEDLMCPGRSPFRQCFGRGLFPCWQVQSEHMCLEDEQSSCWFTGWGCNQGGPGFGCLDCSGWHQWSNCLQKSTERYKLPLAAQVTRRIFMKQSEMGKFNWWKWRKPQQLAKVAWRITVWLDACICQAKARFLILKPAFTLALFWKRCYNLLFFI